MKLVDFAGQLLDGILDRRAGDIGHADVETLFEARDGDFDAVCSAADRLRDKYGESSVSLASGMRGSFRERTHENPAGLPGKHPAKKPAQ